MLVLLFFLLFSVPSGPRFTITSRSVSITWETLENGYTVDVLIGSTLISHLMSLELCFEATSLQPFTNYIFEVQV